MVITHDIVEVWWPAHRRYAVQELNDVYVSRGTSTTAAQRPAGTGMIVFVGIMLVATAAGLAHRYPFLAVGLGLLAIVLLGGLGRLGPRSTSGPWQLRAVYRGADVCLYSSADALVFGQVKRALVRALEGYGP